MFDSSVGARTDANRILIVITDGQSSDSRNYPSVTAMADKKHIIRYAIGVCGGTSPFLFIHFLYIFVPGVKVV